MKKQITGSFASTAPAGALWQALSDPERLGEVLPDVRWVDAESADAFRAGVRPSTNLGATPMELRVQIAEREEGTRVRLLGEGLSGEFRVAFDVTLTLAESATGSDVRWAAEVQAFGLLASLTQRVLPGLLRDQVTLVLAAAQTQTQAGAQAA